MLFSKKKIIKKEENTNITPSKKKRKKKVKKIDYKNTTRVYHVSKRNSDGKWIVKYAGGEKVIKAFDNKIDAEQYTKKMAKNQGGKMLIHASKGKSKGRIL